MKLLKAITIACLTFTLNAPTIGAEEYYVKEVKFPPNADEATKIEMASRVVPSAGQRAWQELELTAFLHFGVNTFTDREWGEGTEDPKVFNPTKLNADQWVETLKKAGFKMVILTAKHHDGFCLWPTQTTEHSVKASDWADGKGDVVKQLREACDRHGMKLGLYLSPWDRNAKSYGDSERYNDMFVNQLTELLGNYGRVDEVWFDGACGEGPNGKKQVYDWNRFKSTIERLQPEAVMAIMGDDVRWVGNENGTGRLTEWSVTPKMPGILPGAEKFNNEMELPDTGSDLGSRKVIARAPGARWWPSEVDVSIRPGWFYHEKEQPKSLKKLAEIYLNSVGRNSVLLLNIPPDRDGLINAADSTRLMELRQWIDSNFKDNLVKKANYKKLTFKLNSTTSVNCVELGEDISKGQRVEEFEVEAKTNGKWHRVARGTTIGYKRILTFPEVVTNELRVVIKQTRNKVNLCNFKAFNISMPAEAEDTRTVKLLSTDKFKAISIDNKSVAADALSAVFDSNSASMWVSDSGSGQHTIVVDMGAEVPVAGFIYTPRTDGKSDGTVFKYRFDLSSDGNNWNCANLSGEFSNVVNNPIEQRVFLSKPTTARYFQFTSTGEVDGRDFITIPEISIITD